MSNLSALAGKEERHNLQKWVSPPDSFVNYDVACDAHHKGTADWCTQGNTFNRWSESGSLLWICGKCAYIPQLLCHSLLTTSWFIAGSGKSVLRCVTPNSILIRLIHLTSSVIIRDMKTKTNHLQNPKR
jgi:hypothetical protein